MEKVNLSLFFVLLLIVSSSLTQSLDPGIWKATTEFKLNGIALPASDDEECITAAEAQDAKATVTKELKRNDCEILSWKVKDKNLTATIKCESIEVQAEGTLKGRFSAKSYQLSGVAKGIYQGLVPATATLKLNGIWVRPCKNKI